MMDDFLDGPVDDFCLNCEDSIQWVGYMNKWMSITQQENCGVCPANRLQHEPSYAV